MKKPFWQYLLNPKRIRILEVRAECLERRVARMRRRIAAHKGHYRVKCSELKKAKSESDALSTTYKREMSERNKILLELLEAKQTIQKLENELGPLKEFSDYCTLASESYDLEKASRIIARKLTQTEESE